MRLFWLLILSTSYGFCQSEVTNLYECVCENTPNGEEKLEELEKSMISDNLLVSNSAKHYKQFFLKGNGSYFDSFDENEIASLQYNLGAFFTSNILANLKINCFHQNKWGSIESQNLFNKIKEVDNILMKGTSLKDNRYDSIEDFWDGEFKTEWFVSNDTKVLLYIYLCTQYCEN
ncbi:hypothetical protein ABN763_11140 [Spongiivirga sp. MCCC 1A20706]|uniref:hypothetical protein n=1 Tax=Spongiivirga sp. MCCC 1A20706 TaxID=3160963 RepID=UPI003977E310